MQITGRTRVYGIVADPIQHVKAPEVMHTLFARQGIDGVLVPLHVSAEGLPGLVEGLRHLRNFGGFVTTVPHKTAMLALCDEADEHARRIGAVNIVRREADGRMVGAMLDGLGFVTGLTRAGHDPAGKRVWLCGAGGAASAIAFALAETGIASLTIANRSLDKAEALAQRLRVAHPGLSVSARAEGLSDHDLIVNATSLGMHAGDALPLDTAALHSGQTVAEIIMEPAMTPLLVAAQKAGCTIHPGRPMLETQIELMARHMGALS